MAYYACLLSFLLFILPFFSLQIEARESKFFTKVIHYNSNNTTSNVTKSSNVHQVEPPSASPSPSPSASPLPLSLEAPAPAPLQSENGYGLYGQGSNEFPPTKTTTTATFENYESENPTKEFSEESKKEYNNNYNSNGIPSSKYNNNGYTSNYNENAYVTEPQGFSETKFMENGKYFYDPKLPPTTTNTINANGENEIPTEKELSSESYKEYNYNKNNIDNSGYTNSYNENAYVTKPQGLSDTRFLENGKYYYNPKNERNYEPVKGSSENNEGYYGNGEKSKYEFDSMEEYEKQEGYPQSQGEYVP